MKCGKKRKDKEIYEGKKVLQGERFNTEAEDIIKELI